eukprot:7286706-Prymnesium_polylepis.2
MLRATLLLGAVAGGAALRVGPVAPQRGRRSRPTMVVESPPATAAAGTGHAISSERPLRVIIAGAG